jgi:DNA-binding NarL/FixJ family response regulator
VDNELRYVRQGNAPSSCAGFSRLDGPEDGPSREAVSGLIEPLTDRELEVLSFIAAGRRNREIATSWWSP